MNRFFNTILNCCITKNNINENINNNDNKLILLPRNPINGYYLWQNNMVENNYNDEYYFRSVNSSQKIDENDSNLIISKSRFIYSSQIPINNNINAIFLYSGYSNAYDALSSLYNYDTNEEMIDVATNYFIEKFNTQEYLIGLCLGGIGQDGVWNTGIYGSIYSIYKAVTPVNVDFSYVETETGHTLSGVGTGILNNTFNSLVFDIEHCDNNSGSTGEDFINLFNYIKSNKSTFYLHKIVIILSFSHSCSNYNGNGKNIFSVLLSDKTESYDYISPKLYTQMIGTTNEYCANNCIPWVKDDIDENNNFVYYLSNNSNFKKYGLSMIIPSINLASLYLTGGSNDNNSPNLYWTHTTNLYNVPIAKKSGYQKIDYNIDNGSVKFFNTIFNKNDEKLGGYIQWINGTL